VSAWGKAWGNSWGDAWGAIAAAAASAQQVTPGTGSRSARYRVRVGKRWLYVDPLDPLSVRAALSAAEDAAQEAAEGPPSDPQSAAVRAIGVAPARAPSVDYTALKAESERIAEQVRAVYAQALQRELIARLMREEMDRDEDEAVLLLLG
jgi:predicted Zn-dependent protease